MIFKKAVCFFFPPFVFTPCHPAVYKIGLSHSAWGVVYSYVIKMARGVFELLGFEELGSHTALWNPSVHSISPVKETHSNYEPVTSWETLHIQIY